MYAVTDAQAQVCANNHSTSYFLGIIFVSLIIGAMYSIPMIIKANKGQRNPEIVVTLPKEPSAVDEKYAQEQLNVQWTNASYANE